MPALQESLPGLLRLLADETRLRILILLGQAELAVGELARCLGVGQSRVSNHLKLLRDAGFLEDRHDGSFTFCRLAVPNGPLGALWNALTPSLGRLEQQDADQARLATVLAARGDSRAFFDRIAGEWDVVGSDFERGTGRLEAVSCLVPGDLVVADVGCGTGYLAAAVARRVARVICIDRSAAMLERAKEKLSTLPAEVDFRVGSLEQLPVASGEVDAAFAHLVLHHVPDVRAGVTELARITRPGGHVVCVELLPHHETWMHEAMADLRLGLDPGALETDLRAAGLRDVRREMIADHYLAERPSGRRTSLPLFLACGRVPSASASISAPEATDPLPQEFEP